MSFKIAVISDLHCHPSPKDDSRPTRTHFFSDAPRVKGNRNPIQYLVDRIKQSESPLRARLLALPGDIADRADHQGYVVGVYVLREVAQALGVETIIATLGNHDVDSRQQYGPDSHFAAKNMFSDFPIADPAERNRFFQDGFACIEGSDYRALILNSVLGHNNKEAAVSGSANNIQLSAIDDYLQSLTPKLYQICLVHHHPIPHEELQLGAQDLLIGGEQLIQLLERYSFSLLVHGHKHHPRIRYSTSGRLPIFASGSLSAAIDPKTGSACRNTFHIVDLHAPNPRLNFSRGTITTWDLKLESGWHPSSRGSSSFPGKVGFGCHDPIDSIANAISDAFKTLSFPTARWSEILTLVPQAEFLIPSDLITLTNCLANKFSLKIETDPAEPAILYQK